MDLNSIKQYNHKIDTIIVTNDNETSLYSEVVLKVNLDDKYVTDQDIIRFSLEPNDNFIQHQRFDNDYYLRIPNTLKKNNISGKTTLYVHYFPADLYEYEEDQEIFSIYDFRELLEDAPVDQYEGRPYAKYIHSAYYTHKVDEEGRLVVQSLLPYSVNKYNDPNYKNYFEDGKDNINMTEQGMFPLSSRYRTKQNWIAPDLNATYPIWENMVAQTKHNDKIPFWEAKINRQGLSPLITNGVENVPWDALPFNVYLNYEYLPTSREYHQHYYGFEPNIDPTTCQTINVFEGTNVNSLDEKFGSHNNYRLIQYGQPYDDSHSMYAPHGYETLIDFEPFEPNTKKIEWKKNECFDFYSYTIKEDLTCGEGHCKYILHNLTEGDYYSLRYYMYIPSYTELNDNCDGCNVIVKVDPGSGYTYWKDTNDDMIQYDDTTLIRQDNSAIYKINKAFVKRDKITRDEWIYHEIPFKAGRENVIQIIGPQKEDSVIFFTQMSLFKMEEYSPVLKYTNTGLYVTEKNQYAYRSAGDEDCQNTPIQPDNKKWIATKKDLPRPYSQVYLVLDHETSIEYDEKTSNLYFIHNENERLEIEHNTDDDKDEIIIRCDESYDTQSWYYPHYDENDERIYGDNEDDFFIDNNDLIDHDPHEYDTNLYVSYRDYLVLVRGPNNKIKIKAQDVTGNLINTGFIAASVLTVVNKETDENNTWRDFEDKQVINGFANWHNIDLTDLSSNSLSNLTDEEMSKVLRVNYGSLTSAEQEAAIAEYMADIHTDIGEKYYLRLEYNNPCYNRSYVYFKPFYVVDEEIDMDILINDKKFLDNNNELIENGERTIPGNNCYIREIMDEYGEITELPLRISAYIHDQLGQYKEDGYCELSINDTVVQTTMVDLDGYADFYLDMEDLQPGCQTIKIEYYREHYTAVVFKYFKLCFDSNIDFRPAIPIDVRVLKNGKTISLRHNCTIDIDDALLCRIDSQHHSEFNLKIEAKVNDGSWQLIKQDNILNPYTVYNFLDLPDKPYSETIITYKLTTGNRLMPDGNEMENKYRTYSRIFKVFRKNNSNNIQIDKEA